MEVTLYYKKLILEVNEKEEVRESKLKTFYMNFIKINKIIQTSVYTGLKTSETNLNK